MIKTKNLISNDDQDEKVEEEVRTILSFFLLIADV